MVEAAQAAVLELAPLLDSCRIRDKLLFFLDKLMDSTEHEVRSAVTHLYAKLGPALKECEGCENLLQDTLLPKLLEKAEDMDFQVRRVCASGSPPVFSTSPPDFVHDENCWQRQLRPGTSNKVQLQVRSVSKQGMLHAGRLTGYWHGTALVQITALC